MNNMLEYLGYHAKIEFDAEDKIFVGEVFGINDSLNFHGTTVQELEEMFHQSIDNYLEMCKFYGKEPEKEFKGTFNVRIPPELHRKIALKAQKNGVSLNQFVAVALDHAITKKEYVILTLLAKQESEYKTTPLCDMSAFNLSETTALPSRKENLLLCPIKN